MRLHARRKTFFITWTVPIHNLPELSLIYFSKIIVSAFLVPFKFFIRQFHSKHIHLFRTYINKPLAQLIIGKSFHFPFQTLQRMRRCFVVWAKHHHRRPPPPVNCVLAHFALLFRPSAKYQQNFETLALMKTFFLTYPHHSARVWSAR